MILLYPVLLALAAVVAVVRVGGRGARDGGWPWFLAWCVAGAAFAFSFLTGLSIGLLVLPFAAAVLFAVAWLTPGLSELFGLLGGVGLILLLVAAVNRDGDGVDPAPWLVAGILACAAAVGGYAILHPASEPAPPPAEPPAGARAP